MHARPLLLAGVLALCVSVPSSRAASFTVEATLDSVRVGLEDTLELQVEVRGTDFSSVIPPDLSGLEGFQVLRGPSRIQRQTLINGRFSSSIRLEWTLGPVRKGKLRLPPLPVTVDGKVFYTKSLDVDVLGGSLATRVPSSRSGRGESREGVIRLVAEVDRTEAYVGEQVTFTLRLLTQLRVRGMSYQTRSDFEGFWVEKEFDYIDNPPGRINGTETTVDGEAFSEYVLAKLALFPTASGEVIIDPINLQVQIRVDRSDSFGSFFFDRDRSIFRRSSPLSIKVLPLPREGRPASFTGAVGDYHLEVSTDRTESRVNDALSLRVSLAGQGQIRTAGQPALPTLVDFRTFDPTVEETGSFQNSKLVGSRSWEYVLVPLAPGEQSIPPVVFSYFDPSAGEYRTLRSDPVPLQIARAEGPEIPPQAGLARRTVTQLQQDIAFIKLPAGALRDRSRPFHRSGLYLALLALPFALSGTLLAWKMRTHRLQADVARRRCSGATRTFRKAMRGAESARSSGDVTAFHAGIYAALTGLVADRENLAAAGLTRPRLQELLRSSGVNESVRREMERILDACDAARFAPGTVDEATMRKLVQRATVVAGRLQEARR